MRAALSGFTAWRGYTDVTTNLRSQQHTKFGNVAGLSGLQFSPSRVRTLMRMYINTKTGRIGRTAPIYLAAIVEYVVAELLELAGDTTDDNGRIRITNRFLMLAIENDHDLKALYPPNTYILGGGVWTKLKTKKVKLVVI